MSHNAPFGNRNACTSLLRNCALWDICLMHSGICDMGLLDQDITYSAPYDVTRPYWVNSLRPGYNGRHFPDDIFKRIFLNENVWIATKISLKCVPEDPINNIPALVQIMACRRPGDKPLSEPMLVSLVTRISVTRLQWVNSLRPSEHICVSKLTIIGSDNGLSPGRRQAIIWTNAGILLIWTLGTNFSEVSSEIHAFSFKKCI